MNENVILVKKINVKGDKKYVNLYLNTPMGLIQIKPSFNSNGFESKVLNKLAISLDKKDGE